ncbi:MAG: GDSL-type esterase/lipase family protein [Acidobacteriota bacterium]|nr:GDSL-type esterase/lipase family protein [Acidobacteriota bacterium]MDE3266798.1 GDSL-type esterase/lipase family protein [Acidobacteriota bacterium]
MAGNYLIGPPGSAPRALRLAAATTAIAVVLAAGATAQTPTRCKAFGDSITAGVGDDPEREAPGYPPRLEELVPGLVVDNRGVGAERTPEGLARIDGVLAEPGDCLLLMEGTNDISRGISPETTLFNLDRMASRAADAGRTPYHATLIPRLLNARFDPNNVRNQDLAQAIRRLAAQHGRDLVDPFEVFSTRARLFREYYYAGEEDPVGHPNGPGYDLLARVFADALLATDTVPPVPTRLSPAHGASQVPAEVTVEVEMRDFGSDIVEGSARLVVGGAPAPAPVVDEEGRRLRWSYKPPVPLSGVVTMTLRAWDLNGNVYNRLLGRFTVYGAVVPPGDVDGDGRVAGSDLVRLGLAFGAGARSRRYDADADVDGSGEVDGEDLAILAANFGAGV